MEKFINNFLGKSTTRTSEKLPANVDLSVEISVIKFLQRIIFKSDVVSEFKASLTSAFSSEEFAIANEIVKKVIVSLHEVLKSDEKVHIKADVFRCVFQSFAGNCKDNLLVLQFFIILCVMLGFEVKPQVNSTENNNDIIFKLNKKIFQSCFKVKPTKPSAVSFTILKELFFSLSTISINLNSPELQIYNKWMHQLIKHVTVAETFECIQLEILSITVDIDFKLIESNVNPVFSAILSTNKFKDEKFCLLYDNLLEKIIKMCAKMQRTVKFFSRLLSVIKDTPTSMTQDMILPPQFQKEFSRVVAMMATQQSLSLMEILVQCFEETSKSLMESNEESKAVLFNVTSYLLTAFLKEVKIYAPTISYTTLQSFINCLNLLKRSLLQFGECLFSDTNFMLRNETFVKSFLEVCFYCGEIHTLIYVYKDTFLEPIISSITDESDWSCCLSASHWSKLLSVMTLDNCNEICLQLALQRLRTLKLEKQTTVEDSTLNVILRLLTSDSGLNQNNPEDINLLMEFLTLKQSKSLVKQILTQALNQDEAMLACLSSTILQENARFVVTLFSELLKEAGAILRNVVNNNLWLLDDYFIKNNKIKLENVEKLPEKLNNMLENGKKIRKKAEKNLEDKDSLLRLVGVFRLLPLMNMDEEFRKLGLCFAIGTAILSANDDETLHLVLETVFEYLNSDTDPSTCFNLGLCIRWLSELPCQRKELDDVKMRIMESLIRNCPKTKFGLSQIGEVIDAPEMFKLLPFKLVETQVLLYQELGKCWFRGNKRKLDNDLIGNYRTKLAKVITEEAKDFQDDIINAENHKVLLKIFAIELNKAAKMEDEQEMSNLIEVKFLSYYDFAMDTLKESFDEACTSFLLVVLQHFPQIRKFLPEGTLLEVWSILKKFEKTNWRLFLSSTTDKEFEAILSDLLQETKSFLSPHCHPSPDYFEVWTSFLNIGSGSKLKICCLHLQELFRYIHDFSSLISGLPVREKICLSKFFCFCVSCRKIILTSQMLDTILDVIIEFSSDSSLSTEDFHDLFVVQIEAASSNLLKQLMWNKNKIHLTFVFFKHMLDALTKRCDAGKELSNDDVVHLATCAFSLEKWATFVVGQKKDFARLAAYFIASIVSSIASVTLPPAVKIHLVNCINRFLSISDSHTVSYLLRVLKPGYQQVFNSIYDQFKKYHKYSGKI